MKAHLANIKRAHPMASVLGCRVGTVTMNRDELEAAIGQPTRTYTEAEGDGKVTVIWIFESPAGKFEIRDYWWNAYNEWSIAANGRRAALWANSFARNLQRVQS